VLLYFGQTSLPWLGRPKQDLSYGIYIYGWPSQQITMALSPSLNPYELTFAALALATFFAFISWRFIEKPAIQLGKEISKSNRFWAKSVQISVPSRRLLRILAGMLVLTMSMMLVCLIALKYRILV
jgi:peptidoglycan/LPS O-acetylase OafA/YrhL